MSFYVQNMQSLKYKFLHASVLQMIGGFYIVTMKSVFPPLSFEDVGDMFVSLFLIKEREERGM